MSNVQDDVKKYLSQRAWTHLLSAAEDSLCTSIIISLSDVRGLSSEVEPNQRFEPAQSNAQCRIAGPQYHHPRLQVAIANFYGTSCTHEACAPRRRAMSSSRSRQLKRHPNSIVQCMHDYEQIAEGRNSSRSDPISPAVCSL